jgi:sugar O-acyltransferase (sialic acid O-acetyltransferase NeuD family)
MMRIIVLGAGGHAQVVADAILANALNASSFALAGFLDDNSALIGQIIMGVPVRGRISDLSTIEHDAVVIGIGDNATRAQLFRDLQARDEQLTVVVHPRATVAQQAQIQAGTVVFAGAIINTGSMIGPNVIVNTGATIDHHACIGAHVHLAPGVHLGGTVTVGAGAFLGIGVNVIPNRTIGAWTTVGAGATVIEDLPDQVIAVGTPARIIKTL